MPRYDRYIWVALWLIAASPSSAATLYRIDQRYGTVGFSVPTRSACSPSRAGSRIFEGELLLDLDQPERSHIDFTIDASAVEMPQQDQTDLLRSDAFFDKDAATTRPRASPALRSRRCRKLTTSSTAHSGSAASRSPSLDATLQDRRVDQGRRVEIADFVVRGEVRRLAFGMVADRLLLSDTIRLDIRIHLEVGRAR